MQSDSDTEKRRHICKIVSAVVGIFLVISAAVSYPVLNYVVRKQVNQKVVIRNGSETYDTWARPAMPIYMQIYIFDLRNPTEVTSGAIPAVTQRGPYTYLERRAKVNIVHNDNGTVSYRQLKSYHFQRNMSCGDEGDTFTTVNMPLMTMANWLKYSSAVDRQLAKWISALSGNIFVEKSVRDVVFGYRDNLLTLGKIFMPSRFYTDIVGIFAGKNNTDDGVYTIFTGESDVNKLGIIDKYNGSSNLTFWTSKQANMINGSDGTLVHPYVEENEKLYMFSSDICRSVYGVYSGKTTTSQGVSLNRYRGNKDVTGSATENPANAGFCTPSGNCMKSGVINLTNCYELDHFQVPLIASLPHFYLADPEYIEAIHGMNPDPLEHTTDVDVEPVTGIVMKIAKRLQINLLVEKLAFFKPLQNIRTMVYPILWLNESMDIDDVHAHRLQRELLTPLKAAGIAQYVCFALGGWLILLALVLFSYDRRKQSNTEVISSDLASADDEPLIA